MTPKTMQTMTCSVSHMTAVRLMQKMTLMVTKFVEILIHAHTTPKMMPTMTTFVLNYHRVPKTKAVM